MFEILKVLIDLMVACEAHGTELRWDITDDPERGGLALRAHIGVTDEDHQMVRAMQTMFEPA